MGVGKEVFEIWAILGFEMVIYNGNLKMTPKSDQNFKKSKSGDIRKKPISRADFEPVASQKCPDFIGPKNLARRDTPF